MFCSFTFNLYQLDALYDVDVGIGDSQASSICKTRSESQSLSLNTYVHIFAMFTTNTVNQKTMSKQKMVEWRARKWSKSRQILNLRQISSFSPWVSTFSDAPCCQLPTIMGCLVITTMVTKKNTNADRRQQIWWTTHQLCLVERRSWSEILSSS